MRSTAVIKKEGMECLVKSLGVLETEIFTMLLSGRSPKEIAHTLKISYYTVLFHQKKTNLPLLMLMILP